MNYNVDELFSFEEIEGGYAVEEYLKMDDSDVTEVEIPAEYNGKPVVRIERRAFFCANNIKRVVLPKSLKELGDGAFFYCGGLESVEFNSVPKFGKSVFGCCGEHLPADVTLMSFTSSFDLSVPIDKKVFDKAFGESWCLGENIFNNFDYLRFDVLELAIKHDCFRGFDVSLMLKFIIKRGMKKQLFFLEEHGMLDNAALLDSLVEFSAKQGKTELTAYLLELKKRKFGFEGGGELELL